MGRLPITLALSGYHHTSALVTGDVRVEGVDLNILTLPIEEIFFRFTKFREWHVSEMSLAKFIALRSRDDESLVGIPVFPSRMFRHSSIYVRAGGITEPSELAGARVGLPEWAQTAAVYSRGLIQHDFGIPLSDINWMQAGVNQPGRGEKVHIDLPPDVSLTRVADRSLNEMLLTGDLDAVLSAHAPASIESGDPAVRRLFDDYATVEREYAARTRIYPIMHVIAIRADVHAENPWLAANLMSAFEESKERSLAALEEITASRIPLPWIDDQLRFTKELLFAGDYWPYGVDQNVTTLSAFCQYAFEQGVAAKLLTPYELFAPEVHSHVRV